MIIINLDKAKNIWRDKIRQDRSRAFEILDIAFFKALESGNIVEQTNIANKKQQLRDATADPRIDQASDVESLKLIDPVKEIMS